MSMHLKHGPRVYRPQVGCTLQRAELQLFRIRWGTQRADDVGAGRAKMGVVWDRRRAGLALEMRREGEHKSSVVLLIWRVSIRLGWRRAAPLCVRQRAGTA